MSSIEKLKAEIESLAIECGCKDSIKAEKILQRFWPPKNEEVVNQKFNALKASLVDARARIAEKRARMPKPKWDDALPIAMRRDEIIAKLNEHQVLVIAGETGSGKTTQLPKMCLEAGYGVRGRIGCTQPRRVAALSVSKRIAEELAVPWGQEVGCQIRFSDQSSEKTFIKLMTDGILLNEIQQDPLLLDYEVIIVDEAHERSLNIDFILGYLQLIRSKRPDLKIIITSATIDTEAFSKAFDDAPIIEVSGRVYPVELQYRPLNELKQESGDFTYIDGVVVTVEEIIGERPSGDILIFLPSERDIREVCEILNGRYLHRCEVMPLFGRLTANEQQRIFASAPLRKIIVATNIAETSITVPGIRYVIDAGMARVSRYSPHTRTQRLPIEEVSQSSANQRMGRCGRVSDGVCFRLYSEEDFYAREEFTTPEILRSNLAAVILRMIAFKLGEVERFPFINPPEPRAIKAGYQLLIDLGALDVKRKLTRLGIQLAKLPIDPTVGRMLLEARQEQAMRHVLVIAAGLSIQDPRERPSEQRDAADQMHKRFIHPDSDFMTLYNIWDTYHNECENMSQRQLRKFCKSHFLAYMRMREWRDIHQQLMYALRDMKLYRENTAEEHYDAIHRSILTGLLGNIANKDWGNHYLATHSRKVVLFPGSGLHDKRSENAAKKLLRGKKAAADSDKKEMQGKTPEWIMCGEWVETSRLFARMIAKINIEWVAELGEHLLKVRHLEPAWEVKASRVLVKEKRYLYSLEVGIKKVGYNKVDAADATEIFIREALMEGNIREQFKFLKHNLKLREHIESLQTRMRQFSSYSLDENIYQFYAKRLNNVSSSAELNRFINQDGGGQSLMMTEDDFFGAAGLDCDVEAFPNAISIDGSEVPLKYHYKPGETKDGVTLQVNLQQFDGLQQGVLDWLVPGYIEERIAALLKSLPKEKRKQLFPIADKTKEILLALKPSATPLTELLTQVIREKYGLELRSSDWSLEAVPQHLVPRVEVVDDKGKSIVEGRSWEHVNTTFQEKVKAQMKQGQGVSRLSMWKTAQKQWEKPDITTWSFGDLPESVLIGEISGVPVYGYLGLEQSSSMLSVRLFNTAEEAKVATRPAYLGLCSRELQREMAWLEKDLQDLKKLGTLLVLLSPLDELKQQALRTIQNYLFLNVSPWPLEKKRFGKTVEDARNRLRGLVPRYIDALKLILETQQALLVMKEGYAGMQADIARLVPKDFVSRTPFEQVQHIPRYLKAIRLRAERAKQQPQKDVMKQQKIQPYLARLNFYLKNAVALKCARPHIVELFWLMEEYRVTIFAQELGTAVKVSEKKLDQVLMTIDKAMNA